MKIVTLQFEASWFLTNLKPLNIKVKLHIIRTVYVYICLTYQLNIIIIGIEYFLRLGLALWYIVVITLA